MLIYYVILCVTLLLLILNRYKNYRQDIRVEIDRREVWRKSDYGFIYYYTIRYYLLPVVKIGRAGNAVDRLIAQRTASPFGLNIIGVVLVKDEVKAENYIHRRYRRERIYNDRRNEWFWLTPRLLLFILASRNKDHTIRVNERLNP
jgi:hypothetical protein